MKIINGHFHNKSLGEIGTYRCIMLQYTFVHLNLTYMCTKYGKVKDILFRRKNNGLDHIHSGCCEPHFSERCSSSCKI